MENFNRQYRLAAGKAGSTGFEIGSGKRPLHVSFSVEKADTNSQNTAKVTIWNLSDEHEYGKQGWRLISGMDDWKYSIFEREIDDEE